MAFWAEVALVVEEVHLCLCASSVSAESLLCHFGKEGSRLFDFHEPLPGDILSQPSRCYARGSHQPTSSLSGLRLKVS